MNRKGIYIILLFLFSIPAFSQVERSKKQLGISLSPVASLVEPIPGAHLSIINSLFITNRVSLGVNTEFGRSRYSTIGTIPNGHGNLDPSEVSKSTFSLMIVTRYYPLETRVAPYVNVQAGIVGVDKTTNILGNELSNRFIKAKYGFGMGATYALNHSTKLDINLAFRTFTEDEYTSPLGRFMVFPLIGVIREVN